MILAPSPNESGENPAPGAVLDFSDVVHYNDTVFILQPSDVFKDAIFTTHHHENVGFKTKIDDVMAGIERKGNLYAGNEREQKNTLYTHSTAGQPV
jgi:hypothetical protein